MRTVKRRGGGKGGGRGGRGGGGRGRGGRGRGGGILRRVKRKMYIYKEEWQIEDNTGKEGINKNNKLDWWLQIREEYKYKLEKKNKIKMRLEKKNEEIEEE